MGEVTCSDGTSCTLYYEYEIECVKYFDPLNVSCFPCKIELCSKEIEYNTDCELFYCDGPFTTTTTTVSPPPSEAKSFFEIFVPIVFSVFLAVFIVCQIIKKRRRSYQSIEQNPEEEIGKKII